MASTKKASSAAHNSRAKSTSSLSGPVHNTGSSAHPAPPPPALTAFNPARSLYAAVSVNHVGASGRERLRVWDVQADGVLAEWELGAEMVAEGRSDAAVRSVLWLAAGSGEGPSDTHASKKKRRHSKGGDASAAAAGTSASGADVLVVSQKKMVGFRTSQSKPAFQWSVPTQQGEQVAAALYIPAQNAVALALEKSGLAIVSLADGSVVLTVKYPTNSTAPSCMALVGAEDTSDALTLVLANTAVATLTLSLPLSSTSSTAFSPPQNIAIAPLRFALPVGPAQLLTAEEGARTASLWMVEKDAQLQLAANIPLPTDAPVHNAALSSDAARVALLASSGEVSVFSLDLSAVAAAAAADAEGASAASPGKKKKKAKAKGIPSLRPVSVVRVVEGKESRQAGIAAVALPRGEGAGEGADAGEAAGLLYARMGGAGRIVWETAVSARWEGAGCLRGIQR